VADRIVLAVEGDRSPVLAAGMGSGCRSSLGCWALGCCSRAARRRALGRRRSAREQGLGDIAAVGLGYPITVVSRWCERRVWRSMVDAMRCAQRVDGTYGLDMVMDVKFEDGM